VLSKGEEELLQLEGKKKKRQGGGGGGCKMELTEVNREREG
jgi:hypothetical protein